MSNRSPWSKLWVMMAIITLGAVTLRADEGRPEVSHLQLYRHQGQILADVTLNNLFSPTIAATLRSGLPVVIDLVLELRCETRTGVAPAGQLVRTEMTYDVWDDIYLLKRGGTTATFTERDDLVSSCRRLRDLALAPLDHYSPGERAGLVCRVAVNPLSGEDRERMADWLAQTVSGEDGLSSREVRLDLGALINSFFRGGDLSDAWGPEIYFGPFDLSALREEMDLQQQESDSP